MEEGGCLFRQPPPVGMMPPQPAIPCRVAPQQSPTPFRRKLRISFKRFRTPLCEHALH